MNEILYPYRKDSWLILNAVEAEKKVDRSVFLYRQTGIPKEIKFYFNVEELPHGKKEFIKLVHSNVIYEAYIYVDPNLKTKLLWDKELGEVIKTKLSKWNYLFEKEDKATAEVLERPLLRFYKLNNQIYGLELMLK